MLSAAVDIQEEAFIRYLQEIERIYVHLPKSLRIRTEKWIEKLVSTGSNIVWRKHRNSYARLLLNMVVTKNFTDPFHALPPEGPLPSFPTYVKGYNKDMIGPHETRFWRDLYQRVSEEGKENPAHASGANSSAITAADWAVSKEIRSLNLLIRDQAARITQLEQQLKDERMQYELEIQRLHAAYRNLPKPTPSHNADAMEPKRSISPSSFITSRSQDSNQFRYLNVLNNSTGRVMNTALFDSLSTTAGKGDHNKGSVNHSYATSSDNMIEKEDPNKVNLASSMSSQSVFADIVPVPKMSRFPDLPTPRDSLDIINPLPDPAQFRSSKQSGTSEDDFLEYIDSFQKELKKVQNERGGVSSGQVDERNEM